MKILELGNGIMLRGLIFENNEVDITNGHPGIVLIPTDEFDDFSYCVHATSDTNRYNEDIEKFFVSSKFFKKTYINLAHIIRVPNIRKHPLIELKDEEIYDLLKAIYDYQTANGETEEFKEIKDKIEAILEYLEAKRDNPTITISANKLRAISNLEQVWRRVLIFGDACREMEGYDIKYNRMLRIKERIRSYINACRVEGNTSIERTESLYNYLKMFNKRDLDNMILCSIAFLKEECRDQEERKLIERFEEEIEEIRRREEIKEQEYRKTQEEIRAQKNRTERRQREIGERSQEFSEEAKGSDIRVVRVIEKIRDHIRRYTGDNSLDMEVTKRLYSDFKVYYKIDLDNILLSAISLLKEECINPEERQLIEKFEKELEEIRRQEEIKKQRKVDKSEQRANKKRKQREIQPVKDEKRRIRNDKRKYGNYELE